MSNCTVTGKHAATTIHGLKGNRDLQSGILKRVLTSVLILLCLASCAARTVNVEGSYPRPNIPAIPLVLGVYYGEGLTDFVYTELSDRGEEEYLVASGDTHQVLFNTVLPAMFERVVVLDSMEEAAARGVDAVFVPRINEFQLGMPQKTRLDSYEVWVRYNMRLTSADGSYIADWVMTAYGKATASSFSTAERGINDAAVAALRDLASNFSLGFTGVPDVRDWLQHRMSQ
ncbi:hypothetical protein E3V39_05835 [Gammaproteobacteria bacterium LSUCC0112]|nr:hypothetical protein E3V39_05835 [Gammaproteobacteria bacterium LSUCC0112]